MLITITRLATALLSVHVFCFTLHSRVHVMTVTLLVTLFVQTGHIYVDMFVKLCLQSDGC